MLDFWPISLVSLGDYLNYLLILIAVWGVFGIFHFVRKQSPSPGEFAIEAAPPSLHPIIDPALCIGCGACVHACPEGQIIGLVGNKAELLEPASCIGHGACKTACPVAAIELVFGTAKRGVDIPQVSPNFQSNVPGLYIAGELGGMGLIANAIEQGCQAVEAISKSEKLNQPNLLDVVIVGGGPAGFAASLAAKERRLRAVTLEQNSLGGTVAHYPRGKIVMTRPARLPLFGTIKGRRVPKEQLLGIWKQVLQRTGVQIRFGERVERVTRTSSGFEVETNQERYETLNILLATGRRGAPRRLEVPGEEHPKVVYSLVDAEQYQGKSVLVVGGGNSAIEAAMELSRHSNIVVTLSYRGQSFANAKPENRKLLQDAEAQNRVEVIRESNVVKIDNHQVVIDINGQRRELANDAVIVCAGGLLPMALLGQIGVEVQTKFGTA